MLSECRTWCGVHVGAHTCVQETGREREQMNEGTLMCLPGNTVPFVGDVNVLRTGTH